MCNFYILAGVDFLTTVTYQASIEGFQKYLNLDYDQSFELIKKSVMVCQQAITEENVGTYLTIVLFKLPTYCRSNIFHDTCEINLSYTTYLILIEVSSR